VTKLFRISSHRAEFGSCPTAAPLGKITFIINSKPITMSPLNEVGGNKNKVEENWQLQLAKELQAPLPENSAQYDTQKLKVAAGGVFVGVSILIGLQFPFLFPKSAPYMATPGPKIRHALEYLNQTRSVRRSNISSGLCKQPPLFVDLGSGDGQAVYEAARLGYRAIGIEFNWTLWAISSLRRRMFWTAQERALSMFLRRDFHSYNLCDADTIMIFAIPKTMPILGTKIQTECKPGTEILAYRFGIPLATEDAENAGEDSNNTSPSDTVAVVRLSADLIYERGDMRIYQMKDKVP
jgi:SAM-dependent methyltransferase